MRKQIILKENELIDIIKKSVLNEIRVENPAKMLRYTDDKLEGMQSIDDSMLKFIAQFFLSNGISPSAVENCKNLSRLTTPLEMQKAISEIKAEWGYYNEIGKEEETPSNLDTGGEQPSGDETDNSNHENEVHLNESQFNGMVRRMVSECLRRVLKEQNETATIVYPYVTEGDWVVCSQCGKRMILPYGADQCPECYGWGTLDWVDSNRQEVSVDDFRENEIQYSERELKMEDYLDPETLAIEYPDYYRQLKKENNLEELYEEVDMGQLDAMRSRPRAKECPSDVKNEIRKLRHLIDEYEKEGKDTEPLTRKIQQLKSKCGM